MTLLRSLVSAYRKKPYRNILLALAVVIVVDALAPNELARGTAADLMLGAILLMALIETVRTRRNPGAALILGLPAVVLRVIVAFAEDSSTVNTVTLAVTSLFFGFLIWNLLHDLSSSDRPTSERIYGALCAYVFIGLFFGLIYTHMEYRFPGTFTSSTGLLGEQGVPEANLYPAFTYFSFATLTTLGYGDITPVEEHARTLVWFEALLGQFYLAVMVAGFVAVHISESMMKSRDGSPPEE